MALLRAIVDHDAWAFARKFLKTEHIHYRAGCMIARYPGFKGPGVDSDPSNLHIDNGNNSLLPQSESAREFGQIGFWVHLEDVDEDQAPLRLLAKEHGRDTSQYEPLVCKGGTVCIFTTIRCIQQAIICGKTGTLHVGLRFRTGRPLLGRLSTLHRQRSESDLLEIHRHPNSRGARSFSVPTCRTSVLHAANA